MKYGTRQALFLGNIAKRCILDGMSILDNIPEALSAKAAALAAESDRTADEILQRALHNGLDAYERQLHSLQRGIDQAKRGEFVRDDDLSILRSKYRPEA